MIMEEKCVLNQQNPLWYLAFEMIKLTKESSLISLYAKAKMASLCIHSLLAQFHLVLPAYIGTKQNSSKWNHSFS